MVPRASVDTAPRNRVEQKDKRRGGRRGRGRRATLRQIHAKATERQAAWLATGHPNVTERLTGELRGLEDDLQIERSRSGESRGAAYQGTTCSATRQWMSEHAL